MSHKNTAGMGLYTVVSAGSLQCHVVSWLQPIPCMDADDLQNLIIVVCSPFLLKFHENLLIFIDKWTNQVL